MQTLYSRVPSAALRRESDGHLYAYIPHRFDGASLTIREDFTKPRMIRADNECGAHVVRNGEALIPIGRMGDALNLRGLVPFGVTVERDEGRNA